MPPHAPAAPAPAGAPPAPAGAPPAPSRAGRPAAAGLIAVAGWAAFAVLRLWLAAGGNITRFVRAAGPYAHRKGVPPGLFVFPGNGYDGQFYYRLALDPADLRRTAFGITMDAPFRVQRIGYPALVWLVSSGHHAWVPAALVAVNVLALGAVALAGGMLARDAGRHACWGLLLAGYFGFAMSVGNDLTEPVAAACLLGGILACRRGRPLLAGIAFGYGTLTRETVLIVPLALGLTRVLSWARRRGRPGRADLAWGLPVLGFAAWQLVLGVVTGRFVLLASASGNSSPGLPFSQFTGAIRMNMGLLWPPTGAAWIWFLEVATLAAFAAAALASRPGTSRPGTSRPGTSPCGISPPGPAWPAAAAGPRYEWLALGLYLVELGGLSADIWSGHADLRSIDEVYLLAALILLGSGRRLGWLSAAAGLALLVAGAHQVLHLS